MVWNSSERRCQLTKSPKRTKVLFRKFKKGGDIIAIFPQEPWTNDPHTCISYQHLGQHGQCSPDLLRDITVTAKPEEYAPLWRELVSIGYSLAIRTSFTSGDYRLRLAAVRRREPCGS